MKKTIPATIPKRDFIIYDPIFRQRIYILLNKDEKDYAKFLNKQKIKDVEERSFGLNKFKGLSTYIDNEDGTRDYLILLKEFQWTIDNQCTLIHEIVHTIIKIWQSNNIPYNNDTQEFLAHSIDHLYGMIAKKLLVKVGTKK